MGRFLSSIVTTAVTLAALAGAAWAAEAEGPWPAPVEGFQAPKAGEHPRLLFRRADLARLKARARTPEGKAILRRLRECLKAEYPVLAHALGDAVFDQFALGYLQRYPSRSYTLNRLGENFPRYLSETRPRPPERDDHGADWPDFLIDLATLELAFNEVFDGPGVEGEPLLDAAQLLAVPAEQWPETRLVTVPCLRLLALRFPVHEYFAAVRRKQEPPIPPPAETFLALSRRDYVVRRYPLSRPQYALLGGLAAGEPVGQAIGRAASDGDGDVDRLAPQLQNWFRYWAAEGFFQAVQLEQR
ncbi:MAG: putative DNA-binding domain-containing protein [Pirellulales bacterium]